LEARGHIGRGNAVNAWALLGPTLILAAIAFTLMERAAREKRKDAERKDDDSEETR
jgi:hypothetical protein